MVHMNAYLNLAVKSTDSSGKKYKYSRFNKFFDYEKELNNEQRRLNAGDVSKSKLSSLMQKKKEERRELENG